MSKTVTKLAITTLVLFIASISIFYIDHRQFSGVIEGNYFVNALDVNKVSSILIQQGLDKKISFVKDGEGFFIDSHHSYPASTKLVNDFLFKVANIKAIKKISSSTSDHDEFGVSETKASFKVTFYDDEKNANVEFYVGNRYRNNGHYIRHAGQDEVYLSANPIFFSVEPQNFFESAIFNLSLGELKSLNYKFKDSFTLRKNEETGDFLVVESGERKADKAKVKKFITDVLKLRLQKYHLPQAADVVSLNYDSEIRLEMDNYVDYLISFSQTQDRYFFKVSSTVKDIPNQIQLSKQADNEQLQKVENLITARGKSQAFNLIHGKWVYEIDKASFEKLVKSIKDFQ